MPTIKSCRCAKSRTKLPKSKALRPLTPFVYDHGNFGDFGDDIWLFSFGFLQLQAAKHVVEENVIDVARLPVRARRNICIMKRGFGHIQHTPVHTHPCTTALGI